MKAPEILSTEIQHEGVAVKINYVFEGLDRDLRIVEINNAPDWWYKKNVVAELEYILGETIIDEAFEKKEYLAEMRGDESRGN